MLQNRLRQSTFRHAALAAAVALSTLLCGCTASAKDGGSSPPEPGNSSAAPTGSTGAHSSAGRPPSAGVLERVDIPARDGFVPRAAYVYLPPAAQGGSAVRLPVLELLHGTPGQPIDWVRRGGLVATLNAFAAAHGGKAPIVVLPDLNGARRADSECIRTSSGANVESYLTGDVVSWVRHRYARNVDDEKWWVAGLSEGGVCSFMLTLRHPDLYSAFADFSGLAVPTVDHLTPADSARQLYAGDLQAEHEHQPLWLLTHGHYAGLPAWFECGASDLVVRPQQAIAVAAARASGLQVHAAYAPGKHQWSVWSTALKASLPWLWAHR